VGEGKAQRSGTIAKVDKICNCPENVARVREPSRVWIVSEFSDNIEYQRWNVHIDCILEETVIRACQLDISLETVSDRFSDPLYRILSRG